MACKDITFDGANNPHRCKCRGAVLRAYGGLVKAGEPEGVALDAARILYRYHHPEDSLEDATLTVERWVYAEQFH